jgi:hypothetical protein
MRIEPPRDPRTAPFELLGRLMPLPGNDQESAKDRQLLHRMDLGEAVRK